MPLIHTQRRKSEIAVKISKRKDLINYCTTDSGIGECPTGIERIFDRFYQVPKTRKLQILVGSVLDGFPNYRRAAFSSRIMCQSMKR